jgi:phosphoadenosine phosphosulfate reductase
MGLAAVKQESEKPLNDGVLRFIRSNAAESLTALEILIWGIENFKDQLALSCSFGAPEGLILLDMMHRIDPATRVFVLDTGRLHPATYELIDRVRERYGKAVEVLSPEAERVESMVRDNGPDLFYESIAKRKLCCRIRKVEPLNGYLAGLDAWVTGLRRDQSSSRMATPKVEIDMTHGGIAKLSPLADWTRDQVLEYVREHDVPINRLHAEGYPSVGCEPCTRAIEVGEESRAGRWWWEQESKKECGIHEERGSGI